MTPMCPRWAGVILSRGDVSEATGGGALSRGDVSEATGGGALSRAAVSWAPRIGQQASAGESSCVPSTSWPLSPFPPASSPISTTLASRRGPRAPSLPQSVLATIYVRFFTPPCGLVVHGVKNALALRSVPFRSSRPYLIFFS
jgi:hypothetical protein